LSNPPANSQPPKFRIRAARRGDAEPIRVLMDELGYANAADSSTVAWIISHPEMEILVAADHLDKPIGVLALSHRPQLRLNGRIATIDELVVTNAWRRQGVGKALLAKAVERARVLSVKRVELMNHGGKADDARDFFVKCGFSEADVLVFRTEGR
jgi:N-acetylglutamate synthase-like GNAT family acetyltransferase